MSNIYLCPKCHSEYGYGPSRCGSCGVNTVDSGVSENAWYAMARSEKDSIKNAIGNTPEMKRLHELQQQREMEREQAKKELSQRKIDFLATTTNSFDGYRITNYIKIESGEVVLGTGIFSEFSASFSDLLGTANASFGSKLEQAKSVALEKLKENCILDGANAVVGVDLDIMTIGSNMIVACANGTAVRIEKI